MPTADIPNDLEITRTSRPKQWLSRGLQELLSIALAALVALLLGGGIYQYYETDTALVWNPNLLGATGYIWPLSLLLPIFFWAMRPLSAAAQRFDKRGVLAILALCFVPCVSLILYFGSRVLGLPDFEVFAGIGALLIVYPLLRFAAGRDALRGLLILALPGIVPGALGLWMLQRRYLLIESMGERFMDPNAQLLVVLTSLCLCSGVALIPYMAGPAWRQTLYANRLATVAIAAGLFVGAVTLIWLNRAILVPRLYLETHLLLAFFEWILLVGAAGWFSVSRPSSAPPNVTRLPLKLGMLAAIFLASNAILIFATPAPGQPVARRSDYLAGFFAQPYLCLFVNNAAGYLPPILAAMISTAAAARANHSPASAAINAL